MFERGPKINYLSLKALLHLWTQVVYIQKSISLKKSRVELSAISVQCPKGVVFLAITFHLLSHATFNSAQTVLASSN